MQARPAARCLVAGRRLAATLGEVAVGHAVDVERAGRGGNQGDPAPGGHQQDDGEDLLLDPLLDAGVGIGEEADGELVEVPRLLGE